jgi:hypothetical protein
MKNINLIWQTPSGDCTDFELEYITEVLFKNFNQNRIFDCGSLESVLDNSVIIYSNNVNEIPYELNAYFDKFVEKGYNFYLLHLSNENLGGHNCSYYSKAKKVFRNYFNPSITSENIVYIPLGVKSGFINKDDKGYTTILKEYDFAFIGQPKSDRSELILELEKFDKVFIHKTNNWNCSTSLNQNQCIEVYKKTKFTPCPMGWVHPDSFRIMETLESSSIPILKNYNNLEYFKNTWGESPLPIVESWADIKTYKELSDEDYKELSLKVKEWYLNFKKDLSIKIENNII